MKIKVYGMLSWIFLTLDEETERKVDKLADAGYSFLVDKFTNHNHIYTMEKDGKVCVAAVCPEGPPKEELIKKLVDAGDEWRRNPTESAVLVALIDPLMVQGKQPCST